MKKISALERIWLLMMVILASYQIVDGIADAGTFAIGAYTVSFGVLLVAGLLIIILGFDILDSPLVVIVSTIIPLSLSLGLVAEYLPEWRTYYLIFAIFGFLLITVTRYTASGGLAILPVAVVHGVSGMVIFLLPIIYSLQGRTPFGFILVGVGGALIGVVGLLLTFLKSGKPILSKEKILTLFPILLLLMTLTFVIGFAVV
jgi:hypothetical protein